MTDITKCKGYDCKIKNNCYRYTVEASEYQSYFAENPMSENKTCDYLWFNDESYKVILEETKTIIDSRTLEKIMSQKKARYITIFKDLGFDSLDFVEFIMNLEKRFNISIDDEKIEGSISSTNTTIFDVMNFLFKNHTEEMFKNFVQE